MLSWYLPTPPGAPFNRRESRAQPPSNVVMLSPVCVVATSRQTGRVRAPASRRRRRTRSRDLGRIPLPCFLSGAPNMCGAPSSRAHNGARVPTDTGPRACPEPSRRRPRWRPPSTWQKPHLQRGLLPFRKEPVPGVRTRIRTNVRLWVLTLEHMFAIM